MDSRKESTIVKKEGDILNLVSTKKFTNAYNKMHYFISNYESMPVSKDSLGPMYRKVYTAF
jgi:hypothetical protein